MVLFWSARLLFLRKNSPLHIYFILHVYCWYLYVQNFTHDTYGITDKKGPYYKFELFSFKNSTLLLHLHLSILGFYQVLCTFNDFPEKNPPCTVLFWSARLLILRKNSPLHNYYVLHVQCVFLRIFSPASLFRPARLFGTLEYVINYRFLTTEQTLYIFRHF